MTAAKITQLSYGDDSDNRSLNKGMHLYMRALWLGWVEGVVACLSYRNGVGVGNGVEKRLCAR